MSDVQESEDTVEEAPEPVVLEVQDSYTYMED